ncbi:MAG: hypothetical protein JSV88_00885 [Candidatus Aminicenantes bacterium]|nr:MAG: hypothetical protein JSV88_00885 [Candidatus Aminicenantes bacterium]
MRDKVTTISIKNKLGNRFGNREIQVNTRANDKITGSFTISPWNEKRVHPLYQQAEKEIPVPFQLDSLDIEALGLATNLPIPISIDTSDDLNVEVSHVIANNMWVILFKPPIVPKRNGDSNVNVTLGQDEPPFKAMSYLLGGAGLGIIFGPPLYRISPILWGAAVLAALAGAAVTWFRSAGRERKKKEGESKETIE